MIVLLLNDTFIYLFYLHVNTYCTTLLLNSIFMNEAIKIEQFFTSGGVLHIEYHFH